ncbi:MAG: DNA repair protein RecO [Saprospiraceae bacterium]
MLIKSEGIILKSVKYSESSLILDIFTKEIGLSTYIISGIRNTKSKSTEANIQVGSILDLVLYDNENIKINRIKEVKTNLQYNKLIFEIKRFSVALFIIEVIGKSIKGREKNEQLYQLLKESLIYIDSTDQSLANFHLVTLCKISSLLGFGPENNLDKINIYFDLREGKFVDLLPHYSEYLNKNESEFFSQILSSELYNSHEIKLSKEIRNKILNDIIIYFEIHSGKIGRLKTLEVFQRIFN